MQVRLLNQRMYLLAKVGILGVERFNDQMVAFLAAPREHTKLQGEDFADPETQQPFEPPDLHATSALQMLLARENQQAVQISLLKIPAYYREVLLLRFHEELGLEEIAAVLAAPISTVKSRLYRGLAALKSALTEGAA